MTTKQKPAYLVTTLDGRFSHVRGKDNAMTLACAYARTIGRETERILSRDYGISIQRVSEETARSVGL
jgi:hypothetical protein